MTLISRLDDNRGPAMGETQEQYEKRKIRERLSLIDQVKHPKRRSTGLIVPGVLSEEDRIREEADRIYNGRHLKFGFGKITSRKNPTR